MTHAPLPLLIALLLATAGCARAAPEGETPGQESTSGASPPAADVGSTPTPPGGPEWMGYRAAGNEPFWRLTFGEAAMEFSDLGNRTTGSATRPDPERLANGWRFAATSDGRPFVVEIEDVRCNDSMSGRPFPHTVTVAVGGQSFTGCGGDTQSLLSGDEWRVTRLEGAETAAERAPTLSFAADGTLTGTGGCNRYRATYEITGEGIQIGPALATRMACVEEVLNRQETRFFALLERVTRFDVAEDGSLQLYAGDGPVIVARRGAP